MINVSRQISYWLTGSLEDWDVACMCIDQNKVRHGLFLAHLALEKVLKAHVCKVTETVPPRTHDLGRLYEIAELPPDANEFRKILAQINQYNLEGRYPSSFPATPEIEDAKRIMQQVDEVYQWLINQL